MSTEAYLEGTIRPLRPATQDFYMKRIEDMVTQDVKASMGNGDFAYFQELVPGAICFLVMPIFNKGVYVSGQQPTNR